MRRSMDGIEVPWTLNDAVPERFVPAGDQSPDATFCSEAGVS